MKATEAVLAIMKENGITKTDIANRTGKKLTVIWDRLSQDNISVTKLNEMIRTIDYKIVLVPSGTRMSEGFYEIE